MADGVDLFEEMVGELRVGIKTVSDGSQGSRQSFKRLGYMTLNRSTIKGESSRKRILTIDSFISESVNSLQIRLLLLLGKQLLVQFV